MTQLTKNEIAKLPSFSKHKAGCIYKLSDDVYIDNISGVGVSKTHQEIRKKGFHNMMPITQFLGLCGDACCENPVTTDELISKINEGFGVPCPRMFIEIDGYMHKTNTVCSIVDFSGSNVCHALKHFGIESLDVQLVLLGYSLRHIECQSDFLNWIGKSVKLQSGVVVKNILNHVTIG